MSKANPSISSKIVEELPFAKVTVLPVTFVTYELTDPPVNVTTILEVPAVVPTKENPNEPALDERPTVSTSGFEIVFKDHDGPAS